MANKTTPIWYIIPEWYGIQQQVDGSLLPITSAYDARNVETGDGNLSVAKGYTRYTEARHSGTARFLKLIVSRGSGRKYIVTTYGIYYLDEENASFGSPIFSFGGNNLTVTQADALQTRIGDKDVILVCTGERQVVKIDTEANTATWFGAGLYSFEGTVSSYDADSMTVTLNTAMSDEAMRRALAYGITIAGYYYDVYDIPDQDSTKKRVSLTAVLLHTPEAGDSAEIRGGGSDEHVAYAELYANRLFAAGDPDAPYRLYWSSVPGDGRTVEDWLSVDGSYDASGGYVEVGDGSADNTLITWSVLA